MKVGLSTIITPRDWTLDQTLQEAMTAGYEALELTIRDEGILTLNTSEADLTTIAEKAASVHVELSSVCHNAAPGDIITNDTQVRNDSLQVAERCLQITAALGVDTMLLTMGGLNDALYYNEAYANGLAAVQKLAPVAEKLNVNIAIEYVWNKFLLSPMEFAHFCDDVASPKVGLFFDTGNMVIFGFPQHWVRICGKHLKKVHFKDFKRQGYEWVPLLEGNVNFPAVMAELRKIGYDGALLSEVDTTLASLSDTAAAIKKIMAM